MSFLGPKAVDILYMAAASDDQDAYVKRQTLATERWREKPLMRKAEELRQRGYLEIDHGRYFGFTLTEKGISALAENLGVPAETPAIVKHADLLAMAKEAGDCYPEECCGLLVSKDDESKVIPCINIQTDLHKLQPKLFPRTGEHAYAMHPEEIQNVKKDYLDHGWKLEAIYHSHVEAPPVFSRDDFLKAMHNGKPLFPGTTYLILGITKKDPPPEAVNYMGAYRWNQPARQFLPVKVQVDPAPSL